MDEIDILKERVEYLKKKLENPDWSNTIDVDMDEELQDVVNQFDFLTPKTTLSVKKLNDSAKMPAYHYDGDSGFDLYSVEDVIIEALGRALIPTGLAFEIPDGYEIQVRSKSGLALNQGLMVLNSPGTVDGSYTGEVKVIMFNTTNTQITIPKGVKIAQAVLAPVMSGKHVTLEEVGNLKQTDRGGNGFGSTNLY